MDFNGDVIGISKGNMVIFGRFKLRFHGIW